MRPKSKYRRYCEVYDPKGNDRVVLQLVSASDNIKAWNSHALIWETRDSAGWKELVVCSREELQGSFPRRRWASNIESFEARSGRVVIMVGEYTKSDSDNIISSRYIRRIFDLANKRLIP